MLFSIENKTVKWTLELTAILGIELIRHNVVTTLSNLHVIAVKHNEQQTK